MKTEILIELLGQYLNRIQLNYAIEKPADFYQSKETNIEIIVSRKDSKKMTNCLNNFCKQNNFLVVQKITQENTAGLYVLYHYDKEKECFANIRIKVFYDYKINGCFYLSTHELLSDRLFVVEKNYWRLNNTYAFIYHFLKVLDLNNPDNFLFNPDSLLLPLLEYWNNSRINILKNLRRFFTEASIIFIEECFNNRNFDCLKANFAQLNADLDQTGGKRITDILPDLLRTLRTLIKPPGLVVGILGRDGCGKSTFISEIISTLGTNFHETNSFKTFPAFFYKTRAKKETFETQRPHYYKKRSRFSSFLKLNLLFAEFFLGYWFKIYPLKIKSHFVLFDRYFIDILADPLRYRIKASRFFIKAYHHLIPQPDVWIIIDLPSDVLLARKHELSFEMAEKLRYEYLNLQNFLRNSIVINNDQEINKTVIKASAFILNHMQKKIA